MLYEWNIRVTLAELSAGIGRDATLEDVPDDFLDSFAAQGFEWIWLLGAWQTGAAGRDVSRSHPEWRAGFASDLPDWTEADICGSPFAITAYAVHSDYGGDAALARLRTRLHERGIRLMLDFVPNHTALDHPWVRSHPEFYVPGSEEALAREPQNYIRLGSRILAHGRDPYFPGWPDTLQLNYGNEQMRAAMLEELLAVASRSDGVRCDMAMLVQPDIFRRTWGIDTQPFWPDAIARVHAENPDFVFMAEVYWDLEWELQQSGFQYTYDERLYRRLRSGDAEGVKAHLRADLSFQEKLVRFIENHDEPRAASVWRPEQSRVAAVITYLVPGLRFFHDGQLEGRRRKANSLWF